MQSSSMTDAVKLEAIAGKSPSKKVLNKKKKKVADYEYR